MSTNVDQLAKQAMGLSPDDRVDLAERLWASVPAPEREKLERAWAEEIETRIQDLEQGHVQVIPADQVLGQIEAKLKARGT
jgi:putative addiction module component (TIGR02574 family)